MMNKTYNRLLDLVTETGEPKRYTPLKGYRPQTKAEAEEIKRINRRRFPKAFNQEAHERKRHPDGRVIQPNKDK